MFVRRLLLLALVCSPAAFAACSNGEATLGTAPDGGAVVDSGHDATTPGQDGGTDAPAPARDGAAPTDAGGDGSPIDAAGIDAGPPPPGAQLAAGFDILWTVTSDGFAIYSEGGTLLARPIAGGAAQTITTTLNGPTEILAFGPAVFVWTNIPSSNVTPLGIWTNSTGWHAASQASYAGLGAASPDGTRVLFTSNVAGTGASGDVVASASDLAAPVTVAPGVALRDNSGCFPRLDFGAAVALVLACASGADAGATGATLSAFSGASFTKKDLVTSARVGPVLLQRDAAGTKTFTVLLNGDGVVAPVDGSPTTKIDTNVFLGYMTPDGSAVVYGVAGGDLRRNATTGGAPTKLVSGVTGFFLGKPLSPTGGSLFVWSNSQANGLTDLYLANAKTPAALATLTTTPNASLPTTTFSADGSHALWFAPVIIATGLGTLHATPTAGGATVDLGQNVVTDYALGGAKVGFMADATGFTFNSTGNLDVADLAKSSTPTRVVTGADVSWFPSPDGTKLLYTWSGVPYQGLWVVPAP